MSLHMRHFGNIVLFVQFKKRENENTSNTWPFRKWSSTTSFVEHFFI